jgi:hypothetical protein
VGAVSSRHARATVGAGQTSAGSVSASSVVRARGSAVGIPAGVGAEVTRMISIGVNGRVKLVGHVVAMRSVSPARGTVNAAVLSGEAVRASAGVSAGVSASSGGGVDTSVVSSLVVLVRMQSVLDLVNESRHVG